MSLPIVAVVGATGNQGGGVVRALSASGNYQIRALTRDPKKATDISKLPNVTLVEFDYNKPNTYNEALKGGVYAVFAVTNFYDPAVLANHKLEIEWGKRLVDAAVDNGVKYFIWSTLPHCKEISNGKYKVAHFDNKAEVAEYARSKPSIKPIFVHAAFYLQNFAQMVQKNDKGYSIALPMKATRELDYVDIDDLGKVVAAVLISPDQHVNRDIVASAGQASGTQFAEAFTRVTGTPTTYTELSKADYMKFMPKGVGDELAGMFQFYSDYGFSGDRYDSSIARKELGVKFNSLDNWIAQSQFAKQN